ncbi:MAG: UDP-2,4-diacetamido-2,4,6-trideoxy-beta-L-altropyranose hydrolase [Pseudomonas palmensis]|uniref:UDP-2,4-diacetamido-2,4, 6-trideoxy-beta-L-altropyranose hydrolase n=1 Tax=Pseudomonas palmensis TaxID=2815362 RepID=UPI003D1211D1
MVVQSAACGVGAVRVVFRTDASIQIGSGHVMRCLALAEALRIKGASCSFICRLHSGHLVDHIRFKGFDVYTLPLVKKVKGDGESHPYAYWLGASQAEDAAACVSVLKEIQPDWLVVDHYGLDRQWEEITAPWARKCFVIDDLANRPHSCDLLLDQNLGRVSECYKNRVQADCKVLTGPSYALLRSEFSGLRQFSISRRAEGLIEHILVSLGGVDDSDFTSQVLEALALSSLPLTVSIDIVMGAKSPHLQKVRKLAAKLPWSTEVLVGVDDMATKMAKADFSIGAAGGTSWERCCVGLPTIMIVMAENQVSGAKALASSESVILLDPELPIRAQLPAVVASLMDGDLLQHMSWNALKVTDGEGTSRVIEHMRNLL